MALDWMEEGCPEDSPVILILPGLTGILDKQAKILLKYTSICYLFFLFHIR